MKKDELRKIINQVKKYNLTKQFSNPEEFSEWVSSLNKRQIQNFNSLAVDPSKIKFLNFLLINKNLLNCEDYSKRVNAIMKLKNGNGCWHLFDRLCSPNFLNSEKFYEDIEKISKAKTARHTLWIINDDVFINSPYHDEDLELILGAKDSEHAEALATTAKSRASINSPYHQKDMKLISSCKSEGLRGIGSFPVWGDNLAINEVSLSDPYHLENMQILVKNPISSNVLYCIMSSER